MSADKDISRNLSNISMEVKRLDNNIKSLSAQNKELDKSLKITAEPFSALKQKSENLTRAIAETTDKLAKLNEKQVIVEKQFRNGELTQSQYNTLKKDILKTENQLSSFKNELLKTNEQIKQFKIDKLSGDFKNLGNSISNAGRAFTPFSAAAAGFLAVGAKTTKSAIEQGAAIDDLAQRYQVSALTVQRWQYVAMQCGVEAEGLTKAYVKARAAMLDLDSGKINEQSKAVSALGINIKDFSNSEEAFEGILNALANMSNGTQQVTLANEIFGDKLASTLLPLLNAGAENIKMFTDQFSELNPLTDEQVSKLAALDDQMYKNKETLKNTVIQIGTSLTPVVETFLGMVEEKFIPKMKAISERFENMSDTTKKFAVGILFVMAALAPLLMVGGKIIGGIGSIISFLPKLSGMLSILSAHPIIAVLGFVAILIGNMYVKNEQFRNSINKLMQVLSKIALPIMNLVQTCLSVIFQLVGGLVNALSGPLATTLNWITALLEPIVDTIAWLIDGIDKFINGAKKLISFGLWDDKKKTKVPSSKSTVNAPKFEAPQFDFDSLYNDIEFPDFNTTSTKISNSSLTDNYNIQNDIIINAANMDEKELENAITKAFNKQMLSKYLAFR